MLLVLPVAVSVTVPLPFAEMTELAVIELAAVTAMLPFVVVVNAPFKVALPLAV